MAIDRRFKLIKDFSTSDRTAGETAAGVFPSNYNFPPGDIRRYGAKQDAVWNGATATGTVDTNAWIAAIKVAAQGGADVTFTGPTIAKNVPLLANVTIRGIDNSTIYVNSTGSTDTAFVGLGVVGTPHALTIDAPMGSTSVTVASTAGFTVGSWVTLNTQEYVIVATDGQKQEINRIVGLTATVITLENDLLDPYLVANTAVIAPFSTVMNNIHLYDFQIQNAISAPVPPGGGVNLKYVVDFSIERLHIYGAGHFPGIRCTTCAHGLISKNTILDGQNAVAGGGDGLPCDIIQASHNIKVDNNAFKDYNQIEFAMRARHCQFTNNSCSHPVDSGVNTHGNTNSNIVIAGNNISGSENVGIAVGYSGDIAADSYITVMNNTIVNCGTKAISVASNVGNSHQFVKVINNTINGVKLSLAAPTTQAILCTFVDNLEVRGNTLDGTPIGLAPDAAISIQNCTKIEAKFNHIYNFGGGGVALQLVTCTDYDVCCNFSESNNNHCNTSGSAGKAWLHHNFSDTGTNSVEGGATIRSWANGWDRISSLGLTPQTTIGAAGGASALPATPLGYFTAYDGVTKIAIPYYNP